MIAIARPNIWTPRAGPWWRLPKWADITKYVGHLKYGAGGHLTYNAGGHLVYCCESGDPCINCAASTTRRTYTATLSGATMCSACCGLGVPGSRIRNSGSLDGTYELTQIAGNPCQWQYVEPGPSAWDFDMYDSDDCTGALSAEDACSKTLQIILSRLSSNRWQLDALVTGASCLGVRVFRSPATSGDPSCAVGFTLSSQYTSCCDATFAEGNQAHSGSVTLTPGPC